MFEHRSEMTSAGDRRGQAASDEVDRRPETTGSATAAGLPQNTLSGRWMAIGRG
jgi:hypothetical protein